MTGFLGAGKTTLLNHILESTRRRLRTAVLVNDFGTVGIDAALLGLSAKTVVDLPGGCVCCTINVDLLTSVRKLLESGRVFDHVLVEASGVADAEALASTFLAPELERSVRLDAVVAVADAANSRAWANQHPIVERQLRAADLIVLNKIDLVSAEETDDVRRWLEELNPAARVLPTINCAIPPLVLLGVGSPHSRAAMHPSAPHAGHLEGVRSLAFNEDVALDFAAFQRFLETLPPTIIRGKGVVACAGLRRRVVFHRVGSRTVVDQGEPWRDGEPRASRAVFIGEGFSNEPLLSWLRSCIPAETAAQVS
jgi:G3E family GTPase